MLSVIDFLFTGIVWGFWIVSALFVLYLIFRIDRMERIRENSSLEDCGPDTHPC